MAGLLNPGDLKKITTDIEMAKAKVQFEHARKREEEQRALHETFLTRQVHPDAGERINTVVRRAAEQGLNEIQVLTFPATYCTDRGRRINNLEPDWPDSLEGFARNAYEYYDKELRPLGFRLRVQVLSFPDGIPGDIGMFLRW